MRLEATTIGPIAARLLDRPAEATVVALFERSFYLETGGQLLCVGSEELPDGPLDLRVAIGHGAGRWADLGVVEAQGWVLGPDRRLTADRLVIDGRGAVGRRARPPGMAADRTRVEAGLGRLVERARARRPDQGLARLTFEPDARPADAVERVAAPCLRLLHRGPQVAGAGFGRAMIDLLGLGPGLTPSGDDLIAAMLITWHRLGETATARRFGRRVLEAARDRTNAVSLAHLAAAAEEGQGATALHDLLDAVIEARRGGIAAAMDAVARIGHCSGWDAMAGIALALAAWLDGDRRSAARATVGGWSGP